MRCRTARTLLGETESSEITPREERALERHLDQCEDCRMNAASFSPLGLSRLRSELPLAERDFEQIRRSVLDSIERDTSRQGLPWFRLTIAGAATLIALLITAAFLVRPGKDGDDGTRHPSVEVSATQTMVVEPAGTLEQPSTTSLAEQSGTAPELADRSAEEPPPVAIAEVPASPPPPSSIDGSQLPEALPSEEVRPVRIELHTSDPTIRIIWIAADERAHERGGVNETTSNV